MWRWSAFAGQFVSQQSLPTVGAHGWEVFVHGGVTYAAYASHYTGSSYAATSSVYAFNPVSRTLSVVASAPIVGPTDVIAFSIGGVQRLVFASHYSGSSYASNTFVYIWNGTALVRDQSIPSLGSYKTAVGWVPVDGAGETPLVLVQDYHDGSIYNLQVRTFEWRCRNIAPR
jgi:hypothetical protein